MIYPHTFLDFRSKTYFPMFLLGNSYKSSYIFVKSRYDPRVFQIILIVPTKKRKSWGTFQFYKRKVKLDRKLKVACLGRLYGSCGSRNFRQFKHRVAVFTADSDRECWSHFSTGVYGSKTNFSLPFFKYWS